MTAPNPLPLPPYKITGIIPFTDFDPLGGTVPSQRVSFTADNGISSSVLVPDAQIGDLDKVRTLVEGKLAQLTNIMSLGS